VRHHVEVVTVADWLREQLGALPDELQPAHWLGLPQQRLLQVTAGAVFHDDTGQLSEARRALAWYPRDVWLWLMASQWRIIADQEPLPGRTNEAGDQRGTRLALASLARSAMQMCFLQERRYWPYTKWFSMAFSELDAAHGLATDLDQLLGGDDSAQGIAALVTVLEHLADRHNNLQIGPALDPNCRPFEVGMNQAVRRYLVLNAERFARACAKQISDPSLRQLPTVGGIDQLTRADDLLVNFTGWPIALIKVYQQQLNITGKYR
jgi:Domain of unknown function (DUF4037)